MPQTARKSRSWTVVALVATAGIVVACLVDSGRIPHSPAVIPGLDKLVHAGMFFAVAFAWVRSGRSLFQVATLCLFLALATEGAQHLFSELGRSGDLLDLVADSIGISVGLWFAQRPVPVIPRED